MMIELRKWTWNDQKFLISIYNSVDRTYLSDRLPLPYTDADAIEWLKMVTEHDGNDGVFRSICVDGEIVGCISIQQKTDVYCKDAEIGYLLRTEKWAQGFATRAVEQICHIAFSRLDIIRITAMVYAQNTASRRVLEKNAFVLEGIMSHAVVKEGRIDNLCIYGKLK